MKHVNGSPGRPSCRGRMLSAAVLALLAAVTASLMGPSRAFAAAANPPGTVRAVSYDVSARYDPQTLILQVSCAMDFEILNDPSSFGFSLRSYFSPPRISSGPGQPSLVAGRVSGDWRYFYSRVSPGKGHRMSTTWTYEGTPVVYDPSQDRYWSRARAEAIWVTDARCWLPCPDGWWNVSEADWHLKVTVPGDWTVFAPGRPASPVSGNQEGWRTFSFESSRGEGNVPCWWLAGPYVLEAEGEVARIPYSVWSLPGWEKEGRLLAEETPRMIGFLGETLGQLPPLDMRVIHVHPDQGGGVSDGAGLTAISPRGTNSKFGLSSLEALWMHEFAHSLAYFGDEGWAEFLALYYVARDYPQRYPAELDAARSYFLTSVGKNGDFAVKEATQRHFERGDIPEWHAYVYVKPALVWNMYRGLFGEEAAGMLLANLQKEYPGFALSTRDWAAPAFWNEVFRFYRAQAAAAADATGSSCAVARAFFDRWFDRSDKLDLALEDVSCVRPAARSGGATPGGGSATGGAAVQGGKAWTVSFAVRDIREDLTPPAGESVPWVEVAIAVDGGRPVVTRVKISGDVTRTSVSVPSRPLKVTLDPAKWLLDYDYSNNSADVDVTKTLAEIVQAAIPVTVLAVVVLVAAWLVRRRPQGVRPPPAAGQAR